ncbi:hypothetical protein FRB94_008725 [Tulasnella sp. JGI-2019a]|nr:hypothetical protein FRB94_008725 [Tulasnella sp. JGI-2019a]KAG8997461.1 hypothetical protein FRB93_014072 [Tulasnella sp. JGI-2019a]KAG9028273.1 hypothetical protein FRB95_006639 [Tulasnella sp. JGI-2019a]
MTGGVSAWPLPRLKNFKLHNCEVNPAYLIHMVSRRYGIDEETDGSEEEQDDEDGNAKESQGRKRPPGKLPALFRRLEITGFNTLSIDDFEEIERIVGNTNVTWDNQNHDEDYSDYMGDGYYSEDYGYSDHG